jgi:colanic acid biosynthesis protein WcaH
MRQIPIAQYNYILEVLPVVCADALIVYQAKCLLLLRDNEPAKNTYWFPGGRIYKNETIVNAALRKAKEETNLDCLFERIISAEESIFEKKDAMTTDLHTVNVCCLLSVNNISNLFIDKLHTSFKWVNKLDKSYHPAVNNPLSFLGYTF